MQWLGEVLDAVTPVWALRIPSALSVPTRAIPGGLTIAALASAAWMLGDARLPAAMSAFPPIKAPMNPDPQLRGPSGDRRNGPTS
ncbi:MAG: hypothetical protein ACK5KU_05335 [Beutenbergiaceae bacterium]